MKIVIIFLLIFMCFNEDVCASDFLSFMTEKVSDLFATVILALRSIGEHVSQFFHKHATAKKTIEANPRKPLIIYTNTKQTTKKIKTVIQPPKSDNTTIKHKINKTDGNPIKSKTDTSSFMTTPQLITLHGRRAESHIVQTEDGYLLTLHRIVGHYPRSASLENKTVLLHHGLLGSSADWILLGPKRSLAYILSNLGYDVWMANARGNIYSRGHVSKHVNTTEFWSFSWQEIGQYDLPAIIHYIRLVKNTTEPISFIGHSMGATAFLVLLSTAPIFNSFFRIGILLAPLAFMVYSQGPLRMFSPVSARPPTFLLHVMGKGEFLPSKVTPDWLAMNHCTAPQLFCKNPLLFLTGGILQEKSWDENLKTTVLSHVPAGGSSYTILHYAQLAKNGKFHKFSDVVSEFPLNRINLPIALISSSDDWLATVPDVKRLYIGLSNPIDHFIIRGRNLSHTEFVWGPETDALVFTKVIDYIRNGLSLSVIKLNEV